MKSNISRMSCQKNESGFIRVNIPITKDVVSEFSGIKKLRLNYWSPENNVNIEPESIHTHPHYFESLVVKGGYTHELYEPGSITDASYDLYRILKRGDKKSFIFVGDANLAYSKDQNVEPGDIISFDKDLIHRVKHNLPETLTLNAVLDEESEEDKSIGLKYYNLFLSKNGTLGNIKTTRDIFIDRNSKLTIQKILYYLSELK